MPSTFSLSVWAWHDVMQEGPFRFHHSQTMRPTYLEVNLSQLKKNIEAIRAQVAPAKVMPMVKANAYGHGIDGVAPFIEPYVDDFGVALVEEGIHLRELGITKPIL